MKINHKRVYRLYRLRGLALRRRTRKRAAGLRVLPLVVPGRRNQRWSMDFLSDAPGRWAPVPGADRSGRRHPEGAHGADVYKLPVVIAPARS